MRDLFVFAVVMFCLPLAFRRPFIGLLLFSWLAYMRPQDLCWSFARTMRFSFIVGITMLVGWLVNESGVRRFWRPDVRTVLMIALVFVITLSLLTARRSFEDKIIVRYYLEFIKIIVIALFTTGQVDTKYRLRVLLWTICVCLAFYGVKGGLIGVLTGGSPILRGPGGMLEDNNDFALALVMNIPLLFYLGRTEDVPWIKRATDIGVGLTIITILLTHSRGGFLALTATMLVMAYRAHKLPQAMASLVLMASMFFLFAPAHVVERLASIGQGGQEASANARLRSWGVAFNMIEEYPFFGVGMRNFQQHYREFAHGFNADEASTHVAHNSYLQLWAESGSFAFAVYLVLLASMFVSTWQLRRLAKMRPHLFWVGQYARMMETMTVGFMVGAMFLNRGHFDLIYHLMALMSCLCWVARREVLLDPTPEGALIGEERGVEVGWRRTVGPRMLPRWGR